MIINTTVMIVVIQTSGGGCRERGERPYDEERRIISFHTMSCYFQMIEEATIYNNNNKVKTIATTNMNTNGQQRLLQNWLLRVDIAVEMVAARLSTASLKGTQSQILQQKSTSKYNYCSRYCTLAISCSPIYHWQKLQQKLQIEYHIVEIVQKLAISTAISTFFHCCVLKISFLALQLCCYILLVLEDRADLI